MPATATSESQHHAPVRRRSAPLTCAFNPKEITLVDRRRVETRSRASTRAPRRPSSCGTRREVTDDRAVLRPELARLPEPGSRDIKRLLDWTSPTSRLARDRERPNPPTLRFSWGNSTYRSFPRLPRVGQRHVLALRHNGNPLRATAGCSFEEVPRPTSPPDEPDLGRPGRPPHPGARAPATACTRSRSGNTASRASGAASRSANGIDDPMRIPPARSILVPPHDEVKALS